MGEDAEKRIGRERLASLQQEQHGGDKDGNAENGNQKVDFEEQRQRHTEQCRMGHRVAEVGHASPDDETTERACSQRHAYAGDQRADEEVVKHGGCPHLSACLGDGHDRRGRDHENGRGRGRGRGLNDRGGGRLRDGNVR
ncbi:hypothetical protein D3C73_634470 [compost metagenome]